MQYSQIPVKFAIPFGANAGGGYINAIPQASQPGGRASLNDGFPPANFIPIGAGGEPPFGADFNGILNQITSWSQWQNAGGLTKYDGTFATAIGGYPFGSLLAGTTAGVLWLNTVDNNTTNPDSGGAGWVNVGTESSPILIGVDTGSANVLTANVTPAPGAYQDGQVFIIQKVASANNGNMTGNIQSLGSRPIVNMDGSALTAGQWPASATGILEYNNATSSLRLLNPAATAAATGGLSATAEQVFSLNISGLPAPTGALSLSDTLAQHVVSDGADREVTLAAVAAAIFTLLGQSLATNGYQKLPGGLILQWGSAAVSLVEGATSITFPIPFPNNVFNVQAIVENNTSSIYCNSGIQIVSKSTTGINFFIQNFNQPGGTTQPTSGIEWFAIGN